MKHTPIRMFACLLLVLAMLAPTGAVFAADVAGGVIEYEGEDIKFTTAAYYTAQDKLSTMSLLYEEYGFELYVQIKSGEVAVRNKSTGQVLFTNPYDVGTQEIAISQKNELLSQILLTYKDTTETHTMNSFADCVEYNQVEVSRIRGGVRVQYTIGETVKRKLAPRQIGEARFNELILEPIRLGLEAAQDPETNFKLNRLKSFYSLKDLTPEEGFLTALETQEMIETYPYCETEPLYVLTSDATEVELDFVETLIETYTKYTMDDMQADHNITGYVMTDDSPPVFQMALEYLLEEDGLSVTLPARGISFDSSLYKLLSVSVLPYFGAGLSGDEGYTFVPDGAGAIIEFDDIHSTTTVSGDLYGADFSFHSATASTMATWRMPVYGVVSNKADTIFAGADDVNRTEQGFVAFMTEGESLTRLSSYHGGSLHPYNSVYQTFYPRQLDSYPLAGITISGGVATYETEAPRKYVGNFTTKYRFLWEEDANYIGMAAAYRDFLTKTGVLKKMESTQSDIPLYITTLGDIDTKEFILGVPVDTKTPLTTFEQAETMISLLKGKVRDEADAQAVALIFPDSFEKEEDVTVESAQACLDEYLQGRAVSNLNLQYIGWYNGGMTSTPPSKLDVDSVLGGEKGAAELAAFAKENGAKVFFDLDYSFVEKTAWFDGFSYDTDAAKTVEGAMSKEKAYNPAASTSTSTGREVISANALARFYEKISEKYEGLGAGTISTEGLGAYLNTDHTKENPINREEAKDLTADFLAERKEAGLETMVADGNAFTWGYADNILNVTLDSSARLTTSREVPFIGMVLHGNLDFACPSINLAGDYQYSLLKTLENGAAPSFTLSYDNTSDLKAAGYSNYYSIQFSIWYDDLIETYELLNEALSLVRSSYIVGHEEVADRIIEVEYENGVKFLLNYNNTPVTYGDITIDALGFVVE